MLNLKTNLVSVILIFLFSILVSLPLLKPGLYLIHDDQHVARLYLFDQSLKTGQLPVRWVDGLGFGFGYPLFNFYPPLTYIIGEVFHLSGFSFIDSIKIVFFISIFGSGVAMFILSKELWGTASGVVSSFFYLLVPYRALDVYVRGALAESFSFVWLPLIFWSFYMLFKTQKNLYIFLSSIFLALLMITHNLIFLPIMLLLPIYLLFLFFRSKDKIKFILYSLFSILYSLALSAFFWLPALLEKKYTIVDEMLLKNLADFKIHFVYLQQLWNWTWGFGGSAQGLADGISFKIGKLHILISIAALVLALANLANNRISVKNNSQLLVRRSFSEVGSIVFFALFLFSAFMTTFYSKLIWEIVKPLGYLQFPWRFLTFTALFSSILSGAFIYVLRLPTLRLTVSILLIFLLLTNLKLFKPKNYRPSLTDEKATSHEIISWDVSKTSFEYSPKGVVLYQDGRGVNMLDIEKSDIQNKLELISGDANLQIVKNEPDEVTFDIEAQQNSIIKANIFNFPGWHVLVNNQNTPINDSNYLRLITFTVPEGNHQVKIRFENTNVRSVANMLTLGSITFLIMLMLKYVIKSGRFRNSHI